MDDETRYPRTNVFINNVDTFSGNLLSKVLSSAVIGGTLMEEDTESKISVIEDSNTDNFYYIVGTLKDPNSPKPSWVKEIYQYEKKEELFQSLLVCDIIIYDNTESTQVEEATWVVSALNAEIPNFLKPKVFICVSTVLTWARTKPVDTDDPDMPFTEEDYRKRKAHPNFKSHLSCEKLVIKVGKTNKSKLMTYVVAAGITYGEGENLFHFLFKTAWLGEKSHLPIFGNGQNVIPTIHIRDLASIIVNICDSKPKVRYILAVDDAKSTMEDIIRTISKNLGAGKIKFINKEDSLTESGLSQVEFDMLNVHLRLEATFIKEGMNITWVSEGGFTDNIHRMVKEYKQVRNLLPLRVYITGPPASGKSTVVEQLCKYYKVHHIKIQDVITEAISNLKITAARADDDEDDPDDDTRAQDSQKLLDDVEESKEKNNGRLDDDLIIKFYKTKLNSVACQNQGFILDGYPKTLEQAKELFALGDHDDEMEEREKEGDFDDLIMPEFVFSLTASDDFLRNRVMHLKESVVSGTHNTEEGFQRRLIEYRSINSDDETVLNYFDELEIHPEHIDIAQDHTTQMIQTVEYITSIMGKERNYGPTEEELENMKRIVVEKELEENKRIQEEVEQREAVEARDRAKHLEEWHNKLEEVKKQECEMLEVQSIPLRNYLMTHVMPTLTQGLIACCKVRPQDPIDFLAEYLFDQNPQTHL